MLGLNKAFLIGHVGQDPEIKTSPNKGTTYCKLTLATPNHKKEGETWVDHPDWHRLTLFGLPAERVAKSVKKGDTLAVECTIRHGKWTDKDGQQRYETSLLVDRVLWTVPKAQRAEEFGSGRPPGQPEDFPVSAPEVDQIPF